MSDPVTNAEVEDVLSSIRRLVSEDKRPMQAPKPQTQSDRLVLTPALRVMETEAAQEAEVDEAAGEEHPRPPAPSLDSLITDDAPLDVYGDAERENILDFEEAEDEQVPDTSSHEDDYSDDPYSFDEDEYDSADQDDAHLRKSPAEPAEQGEAAEESLNLEAEQIGADWNEDEDTTQLHLMVKDAIAEEQQSEESANDPVETDDPVEAADMVQMPEVADPTEEPEAEPATAEEMTEPPQDEKAIALSTKIAALETAIGKIAGTWEPDDPGDSAYAGTEPEAMEWEDEEPATEEAEAPAFAHRYGVTVDDDPEETAEAAPVEEEPVEEPVATEPEPTPVAAKAPKGIDLASDEQILDEEMLRDLVSEIVRAELQGALGERITRNVRKLVRREIHRALTAQELE